MLKVLGLLDTQLTSQHFLSNATMHLETLPLHCSLAISKTLLMVLRQTVILLAPSPLQARSSPGLIIPTFQLLPVLDLYITQHLHHRPTCPLLGLDLLFFPLTSHQVGPVVEVQSDIHLLLVVVALRVKLVAT